MQKVLMLRNLLTSRMAIYVQRMPKKLKRVKRRAEHSSYSFLNGLVRCQEDTTDRSHPPQCATSPEWFVRKTSIAWSTYDAEPQSSPPPMVRSKMNVGRRME
ncbi:hypothetical protein TNCV_845851 [Trichonephila clavipes]|nr:hypothetical protein TNCV_845851 [Trichonephila clavipes]